MSENSPAIHAHSRWKLPLAALLAAVALFQTACHHQSGALATWRGGQVTAVELDTFLLDRYGAGLVLPEGDSARQDFFKAALEEMALNQIWLALAIENSVDDTPQFLGAMRSQLRAAAVDALLKEAEPNSAHPSEEELRQRFEAQRDRFAQPERRQLHNLFLEAGDGQKPEDLSLEAERIRAEVRDLYTFQAAVREHSDSETRLSGGVVGMVTQNQLSPELGNLLFSLEANQVSEVIKNRSGVHLFFVSEVIPGVVPDFSRIRHQLLKEIAGERRTEGEVALVEALPSPPAIQTPSQSEFETLLSQRNENPMVLAVGDFSLHLSDFVETLRAALKQAGTALKHETDRTEFAWEQLQTVARHEQLLQTAQAERPDLIEALAAKTKDQVLLSVMVERRVSQWLDDNQPRLRAFFETNRTRYQRPESFLIQTLSLPIRPPLSLQLRQIKAFIKSSRSADALAQLAEQEDVEIDPPAWIARDQLFKLRPNVANRIDALAAGEISAPFAVGDRIAVSQMVERRPEIPPEYTTVLAQVENDYRSAHLQRIYSELQTAELVLQNFKIEIALLVEFRPGLGALSSEK